MQSSQVMVRNLSGIATTQPFERGRRCTRQLPKWCFNRRCNEIPLRLAKYGLGRRNRRRRRFLFMSQNSFCDASERQQLRAATASGDKNFT
jgi:hypothetical protein